MKQTFNILNFGAKGDYITDNTDAVQKAVDKAYEAGGGIVYFPRGIYVLSTVFLKSNIHIYFEDGTDILGSLDFYKYAQQEEIDYPAYQDQSHTYFNLAMFVARNCENIAITGRAVINMRSLWDEDGVRGASIRHRGPKCISLKECNNAKISDVEIYNATDLAIYFAGCNDVEICNIKMKVYIDGISPDNCKHVKIYNCDVESGDDGIVFKSSYTLNRLDICKDIKVYDCRVKSRCSAIKFGTETNGGFEDILVENIDINDTRLTGIAIESVDGAVIDGLTIRNIRMKNTNGQIFVHLGSRMRGPEGRDVGEIRNVLLENITSEGPYEPHIIMPASYDSYNGNNYLQYPWILNSLNNDNKALETEGRYTPWQFSSNICGIKGKPLKNIVLRNVHLNVDGGVGEYEKEVPDVAPEYPEIMVYGKILPAKGIYFRHIDGLVMENVTVESYRPDKREDFVFEDVTGNF